jgi:cytochrome c oxidase cbb3-type subunit 3
MNVYKTVAEGVLEKGMPAWAPVLGTKKVSEVVAYIMSLQQPPG